MLSPVRLAVASLGCAAATVGLGLAVATAAPGPIDLAVQARASDLVDAVPWAVDVALVLRVLGSAAFVLPLVLLTAALLLRSGRRTWATWVAACGLGGWVLTQLTKLAVQRERPPGGLTVDQGWSYPSGHAAAGGYAWVVLAVVAFALLPRPVNRWVAGAAVVVGLLLGPSRWVLGVHWFSDVVGGWLLACAWVLAVSAAACRWRSPAHDRSRAVSGGAGRLRP